MLSTVAEGNKSIGHCFFQILHSLLALTIARIQTSHTVITLTHTYIHTGLVRIRLLRLRRLRWRDRSAFRVPGLFVCLFACLLACLLFCSIFF